MILTQDASKQVLLSDEPIYDWFLLRQIIPIADTHFIRRRHSVGMSLIVAMAWATVEYKVPAQIFEQEIKPWINNPYKFCAEIIKISINDIVTLNNGWAGATQSLGYCDLPDHPELLDLARQAWTQARSGDK